MVEPQAPTTVTTNQAVATTIGAQMVPNYMIRESTYYAIYRGEMRDLSDINTEMAACISAATFFAGVFASLWIALLVSWPTDQIVARLLSIGGTIFLLVLIAGFALAGAFFANRRDSKLRTIHEESTPATVSVSVGPRP